MKDRKSLITRYFDKSKELHLTNDIYRNYVHTLFSFLLDNDQVKHDITTTALFSGKKPHDSSAQIISRKDACVAGIEEIAYLIDTFTNLSYTSLKKDGDTVLAGESILEISGSPTEILIYERTILNVLQRLIGIATETYKNITYVKSITNTPPYIAATRKTVWSLLDKKAVSLGGGLTHRLSLSDGILVKDNHLLLLEKITHVTTEEQAVVKTLDTIMQKVSNTLIEIEVEKKESIHTLIKVFQRYHKENVLGILLDNFTPHIASQVIASIKNENLDYIIFEASGGINSDTISSWATSGVDLISLGALTHSSKAADISLEM